jgi:hypothetical protein
MELGEFVMETPMALRLEVPEIAIHEVLVAHADAGHFHIAIALDHDSYAVTGERCKLFQR